MTHSSFLKYHGNTFSSPRFGEMNRVHRGWFDVSYIRCLMLSSRGCDPTLTLMSKKELHIFWRTIVANCKREIQGRKTICGSTVPHQRPAHTWNQEKRIEQSWIHGRWGKHDGIYPSNIINLCPAFAYVLNYTHIYNINVTFINTHTHGRTCICIHKYVYPAQRNPWNFQGMAWNLGYAQDSVKTLGMTSKPWVWGKIVKIKGMCLMISCFLWNSQHISPILNRFATRLCKDLPTWYGAYVQ